MRTLLNFEEHERYNKSPQIFDQTVLDAYLDKTLPQLDNFVDCKTVYIFIFVSTFFCYAIIFIAQLHTNVIILYL
jgi:hypothetical protein